MSGSRELTVTARDIEEIAALSSAGSVDELAFVIAQHAGASRQKLLLVTGLPQPVLDRAMSNTSFRRRVTEFLTLSRVTPGVEARILDRMIHTVQDDDVSFSQFREASDWLLQQGGVKRAERQEIEVGHRVRVEFVHDIPEDASGYRPPDPYAGVKRAGLGAGEDDDVIDAEHSVVDEAEGDA